MSKPLKGLKLDLYGVNLALYGQGDPDVPKATQEQIQAMWESARAPLKVKPMGKVVIIGTCEELDRKFKPAWD